MSKQKEVKTETTELAVAAESGLPVVTTVSPHFLAAFEEVQDNFSSIENVRLPKAKLTPAGIQLAEGQDPVRELVCVIVFAGKTKVYYEKLYNPDVVEPPTCFSLDGVRPDASIQWPQHAVCKGCPKGEFGTNAMKKGKACRDLKPMYLMLADDSPIPMQLTITPTSLKAANDYLSNLGVMGVSYRRVKTKIKVNIDPKKTYSTLSFEKLSRLSDQGFANVSWLKDKWLYAMQNQAIDLGEVEVESTVQSTQSAAQNYQREPGEDDIEL